MGIVWGCPVLYWGVSWYRGVGVKKKDVKNFTGPKRINQRFATPSQLKIFVPKTGTKKVNIYDRGGSLFNSEHSLVAQASLVPTSVRPLVGRSVTLSDFHSESASEPSQSVETTLRWPTWWLTWWPTWRWTRWLKWGRHVQNQVYKA